MPTPIMETLDDNITVREFTVAMRDKMAHAARHGAHGWRTTPLTHLWAGLEAAVEKRHPIDIANYAMMIWRLTTPIDD